MLVLRCCRTISVLWITQFLHKKKCFVYTDHKPLVFFTPNTPSRFVRWSLLVQDFQERQRECDGRRALLVFWKTSVLWLLLHFLQFSKLFLFFNSLCTGVTPLALRIFECTCGSTSLVPSSTGKPL